MMIRTANRSDFDAIVNLQIESWRSSYTEDLPAEFLETDIVYLLRKHWRDVRVSDDDLILIAQEDKAVIGFISVWCRPDPFIDNLHVKPSKRSGKVGTRLVRAAMNALLRSGKHTAYLWVFLRNERAIRFYERLGGIRKASAIKSIFGHDVPSQKMEWNDLSRCFGADENK